MPIGTPASARNFPFSERTALQFRAEYFNLLNHTNLGDPGTTLGGTFGRVTSTSSSERESRAAVKTIRASRSSR